MELLLLAWLWPDKCAFAHVSVSQYSAQQFTHIKLSHKTPVCAEVFARLTPFCSQPRINSFFNCLAGPVTPALGKAPKKS